MSKAALPPLNLATRKLKIRGVSILGSQCRQRYRYFGPVYDVIHVQYL